MFSKENSIQEGIILIIELIIDYYQEIILISLKEGIFFIGNYIYQI
jgi:hypothetical protein